MSGSEARPSRRGLSVFAALLAVLLQAFAVQAHVHAYGGFPQARAHEAGAPGAHVEAPGHQAGCIACEAIAANANGALARAIVVGLPAGEPLQTAAAEIRAAPRAITHGWQSRAPPVAL